jgi:hypothetical protein
MNEWIPRRKEGEGKRYALCGDVMRRLTEYGGDGTIVIDIAYQVRCCFLEGQVRYK